MTLYQATSFNNKENLSDEINQLINIKKNLEEINNNKAQYLANTISNLLGYPYGYSKSGLQEVVSYFQSKLDNIENLIYYKALMNYYYLEEENDNNIVLYFEVYNEAGDIIKEFKVTPHIELKEEEIKHYTREHFKTILAENISLEDNSVTELEFTVY